MDNPQIDMAIIVDKNTLRSWNADNTITKTIMNSSGNLVIWYINWSSILLLLPLIINNESDCLINITRGKTPAAMSKWQTKETRLLRRNCFK